MADSVGGEGVRVCFEGAAWCQYRFGLDRSNETLL